MLISIKKEEERNVKDLLVKKAKALLIPYLLFSILYLLINLIEVKAGVLGTKELSLNVLFTINLYSDSTLWFLPALFLAELMFILPARRINKDIVTCILVILGAVSYPVFLLLNPVIAQNEQNMAVLFILRFVHMLLRGVLSASFIAVGHFLQSRIMPLYERLFENRSSGKRLNIYYLLAGIVLMGILIPVSFMNDKVDYRRFVLGNLLFFYVGAVIGSLGLIFISKGIKSIRVLEFYGKNSLIVMCTHLNCYVVYLAIQWAFLINTYVSRAKDYVFMANIILVCLVLEAVLIFVINRFLPFMLGRGYERK